MKKAGARPGFLPTGSVEALRRLGVRVAGLGLAVLAIAVALALVTANAADPSWNTAVDTEVGNALGAPGAVIADLLLQTFGLGAGFAVLVGVVWGLRIMVSARLPAHWPWRLAALLAAVLAWGAALAPLPLGGELPAGPGGSLGTVIDLGLAGLLPADLAWVPAVLFGLAAAAASAFAIGLSAEE